MDNNYVVFATCNYLNVSVLRRRFNMASFIFQKLLYQAAKDALLHVVLPTVARWKGGG